MKGRGLTEYKELSRSLTAYTAVETVESSVTHAGWVNWSSMASVRALAVGARTRRVWAATGGGVVALDTRPPLKSTRYRSEHGLSGNAVECLALDADENPWAGTAGGGLCRFDGVRWAPVDGMVGVPVRAVCLAANGSGIWAAGEAGVYWVPVSGGPPRFIVRAPGAEAGTPSLVDSGEGLVLGNNRGLFRLEPGGELVQLFPNVITACTALASGEAGGVWVGTPGAVYRWDGEELVGPIPPATDPQPGRVIGLSTANAAQVWVLTTEGLARVTGGRWQPVPPPTGGAPPAIRALAAAPGGTYLWASTDHLLAGVSAGGTDEIAWDLERLLPTPEDSLSNLGRCVAPRGDCGAVWVGSAGGLLSFEPDGTPVTEYDGVDVRSLCQSADGSLWLLTWPDGVLRREEPGTTGGRPVFRRTENFGLPVLLAAGPGGAPHVVTERGLFRLGGVADPAVTRDVPAGARCLVYGPEETWWLGTSHGAYSLAPGSGWRLAGERPGPLLGEIHALAVVQGALWAATSTGLWERRGDGWLQRAGVPGQEAIPVQAVARAGAGKAWLARPDGLALYEIETDQVETVFTAGLSGLASHRVSAPVETCGQLWVITRAGVSRWAPAHDKPLQIVGGLP